MVACHSCSQGMCTRIVLGLLAFALAVASAPSPAQQEAAGCAVSDKACLNREIKRLEGEVRRARSEGEEGGDNEDLAFALDELAQAHYRQGRGNQALALLDEAIGSFPGAPSAFRVSQRRYFMGRKAEMLGRLGRNGEAFALLWTTRQLRELYRDPFTEDGVLYLEGAVAPLMADGRRREAMTLLRAAAEIETAELHRPGWKAGNVPSGLAGDDQRLKVLRAARGRFDAVIANAWQLAQEIPDATGPQLERIEHLLSEGDMATAVMEARASIAALEQRSTVRQTRLIDASLRRAYLLLAAGLEHQGAEGKAHAARLLLALYDELTFQSWRGDDLLVRIGITAARLVADGGDAKRAEEIAERARRHHDAEGRTPRLAGYDLASVLRELPK
jgi:tetratricopeptide (TPR) repeat protein